MVTTPVETSELPRLRDYIGGELVEARSDRLSDVVDPCTGEIYLKAPVSGAEDVDAAHADWAARGIAILQPPEDAEFGRSFVAADPDGHRLRVMNLPA